MNLPRRLGLTGSIGAGKSTVAELLRNRGFPVLDADAVAREVTEDPAVLRELAAAFPGVVHGGRLDRAALASRVFGDPAALAQLNALTHPRVRARMAELEKACQASWAVHDIPLLFEGGLESGMDALLVVDAPLETRLERVRSRSGLSEAEVLARDARQLPASEKRRRAAAHPRAAVLDNAGSLRELEQQLDQALRQLGVELAH
ncbi:dephospho-CoA kinase [Deinococcus lacus]|uniref:Dephospho-CoA kinase n=1 Tax=Deinococcus lacus TaxID=392561 RepID=A0ABW1YBQ1_9DEIO